MTALKKLALISLFPLGCVLPGCVSTSGPASAGNEASANSEKATASEDKSKAMQKISKAIGIEPNAFSITNQQATEAPTGYNGTEYTVKTQNGKIYKCDILEPSGLGKVMTWGMASGASAMCTDFTPGSKDRGKTNKASCNDLLKAAGKC